MASPLAWFRRNQKGMLIVFGVLLMAVFGLPSVFFNLTPQGGRNPEMNEVVVSYSGGQYTRGQLRDYRYRNAQAIRFIQELQQAAAQTVGVENFRPRAALLSPIDTSGSPEMLDRQVMRRLLLKKKSDELGMVVGDEAVLDYLQAITANDDLTFSDLNQFAFQIFNGNPDFASIKAQLKKEIAFEQMIGVVQTGLPRAPNVTNAWENFLKLNKRRGATVLEFPVNKYVDSVSGEPKLSELREIFSKGEYEFPDPTNENPGFKAARKIKAAVLTADYETFLANAENSIKPEDIKKLYDEYVAAKNPIVMEVIPAAAPEEGANGDDPAPEFNLDGDDDATQGDAEMKSEKPEEAKTEEAKTEEAKTEEAKTEEGKTEEAKTEEAKTEEAKTEEAKTEEAKTEEGKTEDENDGLPTHGPTARVLQEDQQEGGDKATEQEDASKSDEQAKPAETKPAETKPAETKPAEAAAANQEPTPATDSVEVTAGPPAGLTIDDLNTTPKTQVRELDEELSKILRRELARVPATNAMATALTEAAGDIGDYGSDLVAYETTKDGPVDEREPMPEDIDLAQIARDYKLQLQETDLVEYDDLKDQPLGQLGVTIQRVFYGRPFQDRIGLAEYLFGNYFQLNEWSPETLMEFGTNNQHIVVFLEKEDTRLRTFDEAKEDVEAFWRKQLADNQARDAATKIADEVNSSGKSLIEQFPNDAKAVGEFSWNTTGQLYPVLDGAVRTGPEFMETAFGLDLNKASVAFDATKDHVYVIQVTAVDQRTDEELQDLFFTELAANATRGGMSDGINRLYEVDTQEFISEMFAEINKEYDVKWLAH